MFLGNNPSNHNLIHNHYHHHNNNHHYNNNNYDDDDDDYNHNNRETLLPKITISFWMRRMLMHDECFINSLTFD